jgi:hypothetical protein
MMTQHEYEFLTDSWTGLKGAAYNQVYEFCKEFGWLEGFYPDGATRLTQAGMNAIKAYQANENYKRIDVI